MHYTQRAVWRKRGGSCDTEQVTSYVALVRALPIPPPAAKPPGVVCQWGTQYSVIDSGLWALRNLTTQRENHRRNFSFAHFYSLVKKTRIYFSDFFNCSSFSFAVTQQAVWRRSGLRYTVKFCSPHHRWLRQKFCSRNPLPRQAAGR